MHSSDLLSPESQLPVHSTVSTGKHQLYLWLNEAKELLPAVRNNGTRHHHAKSNEHERQAESNEESKERADDGVTHKTSDQPIRFLPSNAFSQDPKQLTTM
jgi:hypothetical protein